MIEIGRKFAVDRDKFLGARVNELEMGGMKSHTIDTCFVGFGGMEFSVPDYGMAEGGELSADLIL